MQNRTTRWMLVLVLTNIPVFVGAVEALQREFPEREPFFGQPIDLLRDVIIPSAAVPAVVLGVVGYLLASTLVASTLVASTLVASTLTSKHLHRRSWPAQLAVVGVLTLLAITALWLCIIWVHWNVVSAQHRYWDLLFTPVINPEPWLFAVGMMGTIGLFVVASYLAGVRLFVDRRWLVKK